MRFGVNCYGHKPKVTDQKLQYMEDAQTHQDRQFEKKVTPFNEVIIHFYD